MKSVFYFIVMKNIPIHSLKKHECYKISFGNKSSLELAYILISFVNDFELTIVPYNIHDKVSSRRVYITVQEFISLIEKKKIHFFKREIVEDD